VLGLAPPGGFLGYVVGRLVAVSRTVKLHGLEVVSVLAPLSFEACLYSFLTWSYSQLRAELLLRMVFRMRRNATPY
jgi:hypothetical protein